MLEEKIKFVHDLESAILPVQPNIERINYAVSYLNGNQLDEFLLITYVGGAQTARNCTWNSCSAIYRELGNYLTTWGDGAQIEYFKSCLQNENMEVKIF